MPLQLNRHPASEAGALPDQLLRAQRTADYPLRSRCGIVRPADTGLYVSPASPLGFHTLIQRIQHRGVVHLLHCYGRHSYSPPNRLCEVVLTSLQAFCALDSCQVLTKFIDLLGTVYEHIKKVWSRYCAILDYTFYKPYNRSRKGCDMRTISYP